MNSIGKLYRLTTFGESHGPAIGGIIEGFPPGVTIDVEAIQRELDNRKPGKGDVGASMRNENDKVQLLSGIFEGKSLGTPIGFIIPNNDARSEDYEHLRDLFRPSHADFTYQMKYGIRDHRGGGRASARETACRVVAGALARQILMREGIMVYAYTSSIGDVAIGPDLTDFDITYISKSPVRCPSPTTSRKMEKLIAQTAADGDTIGGVVTCFVTGVPAGLGEPVFDKLEAMLAHAMLSIPAAKGFDYGSGFASAQSTGSNQADYFVTTDEGEIITMPNFSGGIQGGISNGMPIIFRVPFKPAATMMRPLDCLNRFGQEVTLQPRGRHDVCVVPRAVPVVEAMACMTLLDAYMQDATMLTPPSPPN